MNDAELKQKFEELHKCLEVVAKAVADQQLLTIRMMSHQQAHLAAIRSLLVRQGEDRAMLNQRLGSVYATALHLYRDQLEAYYKSGDAKKFVEALIFTDEIQSN